MDISSTKSVTTNADSLESILWPFRRLGWDRETSFVPLNYNLSVLTSYSHRSKHTLRVWSLEFDIWQDDAVFQLHNCFYDAGDRRRPFRMP